MKKYGIAIAIALSLVLIISQFSTVKAGWDEMRQFAAYIQDSVYPSVADDGSTVTVTGALVSTGILSGLTGVTLDTSDATITLTAAMCDGRVRVNNDADVIDYNLPAAAAGLIVFFYDIAGGVITVDSVGDDVIYLDGVALDAADSIDSPGAAGDFICLLALDATRWITLGRSGTWIDAGP